MKAREEDFTKAKRGALVQSARGQTLIAIRNDNDLLEWVREQVHKTGGGGCKILITDAVRSLLHGEGRALEKALRKITREGLQTMAKRAA